MTTAKMRVKKGDTVKVIAGKDKGKTGVILKTMPKDSKLIVKGVQMVKKHQAPSRVSGGGIFEKESPIHVSNVMLVDKDGQPTKVTFEVKDGKKVRVAKKTGTVIEG
jgi:large subunit ribosomal protein L24